MGSDERPTILKVGKQFRSLPLHYERVIEPGGDGQGERVLYKARLSTETTVQRWFGREKLIHSPEAVDMSRMLARAAVYVDHKGDQVGVVERAVLVPEERALDVWLRFSKNPRGQEVERDIQDGIRTHLSAGYIVKEMTRTKRGQNEFEDEYDATRWQPAEASVVGTPADLAAVFRSEDTEQVYEVQVRDAHLEESTEVREESTTMSTTDPAAPAAAVTPPAAVVGRDFSAEAREIFEMAQAHKMPMEVVADVMGRGLTPDQAGREFLNKRAAEGAAAIAQPPMEGLPKKDRQRYSVRRALQMMARSITDPHGAEFNGVEGLVHRKLEKELPDGYEAHGGFFVPWDHRTSDEIELEREIKATRALDTKTATAAAEIVFDQPGPLIEYLRASAKAIAMGAQVLTGLRGPVPFPRQAGVLTAYWVPENPGADATASDISFGQVTLIPKTLQATTGLSRQLLVQSSIDIEGMLRSELAFAHGLALDRAVYHGSGVNNEPAGLYKLADVGSKTYSAPSNPSWTLLIDAVGQMAAQNALFGNLGWITHPTLAAVLARTLVASNTSNTFLWQGPLQSGQLAGYRAESTTQISNAMTGSEATGGSYYGLIFGDWSQLLIGMWNAMELIIDPYALKKRAMIEITSFEMADIQVRHPQSFVKHISVTGT